MKARGARSNFSRAVFIGLLVAIIAATAQGAPPPRVAIRVTGACPASSAVAAALQRVFPETIVVSPTEPSVPVVEIVDLEAAMRVAVEGHERSFADPARRCDERANTGIGFASLVLDPPQLTPSPNPRQGTARNRRLPTITLQLGAELEAAPRLGTDNGLYTAGAMLRLFMGSPRIGALLGIEGLSPSTMLFASARARLQRVPIDAGIRGILRRGRWSFAADVEALIAALVVSGRNVTGQLESSGIELGLRGALQANVAVSRRLSSFLALEASVLPHPHELVVASMGSVGSTPVLWLGAALGLEVNVR